MARRRAEQPDLIDTAFGIIAERGWAGFAMADLAERAGLSLAEVYARVPSRTALLDAFGRRVDQAMLVADRAEILELPARERVFELLMRRFDALQPYRKGLEALARDGRRDPGAVLATLCSIDRGVRWLIEAAELDLSGLRREVARRALTVAYGLTLRVWLEDDSPDLAKTLAELDRRLRQLDSMGLIGEARARPAAAQPTADAT